MPNSIKLIELKNRIKERMFLNKRKLFLMTSAFLLISFGSYFVMNVLFPVNFDSSSTISFHKKKFQPLGESYDSSLLMKTSTPFKSHYSFKWIDRDAGTALLKVHLSARNFLENQWSYQWFLPVGVSSSSSQVGVFDLRSMGSKNNFEIELQNLDREFSQNIIFKVKPLTREDLAMSVVIPSQEDQTSESRERKRYQQKVSAHAQEKTLNEKSVEEDSTSASSNPKSRQRRIYF